MAGIKIVDLPAVGRDLAATDLFEMSLVGGTGSRKITGQEIMNASKLSVNNTPVINGTAGRIFFQGSTNVLQQSGNLFWDSTNNRLGIGTSTPARTLEVNGETILRDALTLSSAGDRGRVTFGGGYFAFQALGNQGISLMLTNNTRALNIIDATGNVLINTTTDAGFRLDVNGTARVQGLLTTLAGVDLKGWYLYANGTSLASIYGGSNWIFETGSGGGYRYRTFGGVERMRLESSGNLLINTTTDDGFKLDVNGTARTKYLTIESAATFDAVQFKSNTGVIGYLGSDNGSAWIASGANLGGSYLTVSNTNAALNAANNLIFRTAGTERARFHISTGNFSINSGTDAGYKLDVNGTTIVRGVLNVGTISTGFNFSGADCAIFNNGGSGGAISLSMGGNTYLRIYQPINAGSGITVGAVNTITTPITYAWASGTASPNLFQLNPNYNFTGTYSGIVRGFYYNPSLSSMTGVTHYAIHSTSGRVRLEGLPTSPTGLSAGDLWNNGGVINIV